MSGMEDINDTGRSKWTVLYQYREKLNYYEEKGLIRYETLVDGVPDYTEDEFHKAGIIHALMEAGMDADAVGKYLGLLRKKIESREEQIRILRKQRYRLPSVILLWMVSFTIQRWQRK